jgi:hypothetical protein
MTKIGPVVKVIWHDAWCAGGWKPLEVYAEETPVECYSVGFLVKKTRTHLTLLQTFNAAGRGTDSITIPRSWVQEVVEL